MHAKTTGSLACESVAKRHCLHSSTRVCGMGTIVNSYLGGPLDENSFRVIEIQPGERDEPVTAHLITTNLRDCSSYEALSHAWGDLTQTEPIQVVAARLGHEDIPKAPLSVTIGCADALRRLRSGMVTRTLWLDYICINQSLVPAAQAHATYL